MTVPLSVAAITAISQDLNSSHAITPIFLRQDLTETNNSPASFSLRFSSFLSLPIDQFFFFNIINSSRHFESSNTRC